MTSWMNSIKVFLLTAVLLVLAAYGECHAATTGNLKIAMLAVGSADATVFVFPNGKTMLVDCGLEVNCKNDVIPFLNRQKITHLDYFMITHPHADHDGNGKGKSLLTSAGLINSSTKLYDFHSFKVGDKLTLEGTNVLILNAWHVKTNNHNTNSITFRMEYNGYVYQHGGDLDDSWTQKQMLARFKTKSEDMIQCHFFHVFHHMYGGISDEYLRATNYQIALVSCGKDIVNYDTWKHQLVPACEYLKPSAGHGGRYMKRYLTGARGSVADGNVVMRIGSATEWSNNNYTDLKAIVPDFPGVTSGIAHTITASTSTGGTISPSGAASVSQGTSQTFTITPSAGYMISSLKVDNVTVAAAPTYTFSNVQAVHSISATFALVPITNYTLTVNSGIGSGNYTTGKLVTITANPAPAGHVFNAWTGNTTYVASINSPSTTVTMPSVAVTLTATYKASPPPPPAVAVVYEAENAVVYGARIYGSYVDYVNPSNDYIEWTVNIPRSGNYTLSFRYAHSSGNRPLKITRNDLVNNVDVNEVIAASLSFPASGSTSNYISVSTTATLTAGIHKIRATAITASGSNMDSLTVTPITAPTGVAMLDLEHILGSLQIFNQP